MNAFLLVTTVPGFVRNPIEKQQADNYSLLEAFHANRGNAKKESSQFSKVLGNSNTNTLGVKRLRLQ